MRPGSVIIKECPVCSLLIRQYTITSGNTFGAILWTDGKRYAPMLPDQPLLVMCPLCQTLVWIDELRVISEDGSQKDSHGYFDKSVAYEMPSFNDYVTFLENNLLPSRKEHYVRLRLWWLDNDVRRDNANEIPLSSREMSNLTAFAELLNEENATDLLMKAEVMRELGRFDEANALLSRLTDRDLSKVAKFIKGLVIQGDYHVRKVHIK